VHQKLDELGKTSETTTRRYDYMANIVTSQQGVLRLLETRNGSDLLDVFPEQIATAGLAS
jgi:hypothetical protein